MINNNAINQQTNITLIKAWTILNTRFLARSSWSLGPTWSLTSSIPSSQCKFSQPLKKKMYDKSLVKDWKRKLTLITLRSGRVNLNPDTRMLNQTINPKNSSLKNCFGLLLAGPGPDSQSIAIKFPSEQSCLYPVCNLIHPRQKCSWCTATRRLVQWVPGTEGKQEESHSRVERREGGGVKFQCTVSGKNRVNGCSPMTAYQICKSQEISIVK